MSQQHKALEQAGAFNTQRLSNSAVPTTDGPTATVR